MRKIAFVLAALIAASLAASPADARGKKRAAAPKPDPAIAAQQNTARLFADMFRGPQPAAPAKPARGKKRG
jgi:hypothetical protein